MHFQRTLNKFNLSPCDDDGSRYINAGVGGLPFALPMGNKRTYIGTRDGMR